MCTRSQWDLPLFWQKIIVESQNGLEGTCKGHPVQPPVMSRDPQLEQIAQSPIQSDLEFLQDGESIISVDKQFQHKI